MIRLAAASLALLAAGVQDQPRQTGLSAALQIVIRQQVIIRVPQHPNGVPAMFTPARWREGAPQRCLQANHILAALPSQNNVDFILRDNSRVRAHLSRRCTGLDYYRGIYVDATPDGRICAARDPLRSRMGDACDIAEFRPLQPMRP